MFDVKQSYKCQIVTLVYCTTQPVQVGCSFVRIFCVTFQVDWPTKLYLSHGVVCGMEYLHSRTPHPVIHGDLKIQNVLVGDGLVAKVCITLYIQLWQGTVSCSRSRFTSVCLSVIKIISNLCTHFDQILSRVSIRQHAQRDIVLPFLSVVSVRLSSTGTASKGMCTSTRFTDFLVVASFYFF